MGPKSRRYIEDTAIRSLSLAGRAVPKGVEKGRAAEPRSTRSRQVGVFSDFFPIHFFYLPFLSYSLGHKKEMPRPDPTQLIVY